MCLECAHCNFITFVCSMKKKEEDENGDEDYQKNFAQPFTVFKDMEF